MNLPFLQKNIPGRGPVPALALPVFPLFFNICWIVLCSGLYDPLYQLVLSSFDESFSDRSDSIIRICPAEKIPVICRCLYLWEQGSQSHLSAIIPVFRSSLQVPAQTCLPTCIQRRIMNRCYVVLAVASLCSFLHQHDITGIMRTFPAGYRRAAAKARG